jgi:glycosyltransferase 2 family protein
MSGRGILRPGGRLRVWIERAGLAGALALTAWFGWSLVAADWAGLAAIDPVRIVIACGIGAFAYAALGGLLMLAWRQLLVGFGGDPRGHGRIYALSQAMKYLPGNVMHFAGRHAMGRRLGAPHRLLILAAAAEVLLLLVAGAAISLLAGPGIADAIAASTGLPMPGFGLLVPAGLALAVAIARVGRWLAGRMRAHGLTWDRLRGPLLIAGGLYVSFFFGCGLVGAWLLAFALGVALPLVLLVTGALALAWTVGFLTPGAPAGLGVREIVLATILSPFLGATGALALAALYRITTVAGDGLLALIVLAGTRRSAPEPFMEFVQ